MRSLLPATDAALRTFVGATRAEWTPGDRLSGQLGLRLVGEGEKLASAVFWHWKTTLSSLTEALRGQ